MGLFLLIFRSSTMASVVLMVGGALVNALAFSGSNYLFSKLAQSDRGDTAEEQKRHDEAMEQLQTAQTEWSNRRTQRLDKINEELQDEHRAVQDFHTVSTDWKNYTLHNENPLLADLGPEPQLSDFFTPSSAQKDREISFVIGGMVVTCLVTYYIAKR